MKKTTLIFLLGLLSTQLSIAQSNQEPCAFDRLFNNESILGAEKMISKKVEYMKNKNHQSPDSVIKIIPVVVHIFHTGGAENISQAQIESQIRILNEDYGRISGTNGYGSGVDTKVRFCLATIDPDGDCTNGVVRINSSLANHQTYQRALLKQLSFWDNTRYLNIYVVKSINGNVAGYSSFPGGPPEEDGMVVQNTYFGDIGTASGSLGRTTSHEMGHWFGLYHTFNNGCGTDVCTDGDYVCDTPPQATASFNCNTLNTCSNDIPDLNDLKENYMNYTPDACKDMFTEGQKQRIHAALDTIRTLIWSNSNLIATGCDSLYIAPLMCNVKANFSTLTKEICIGNNIEFIDISQNDATSWNWNFQGGTPATSIVQNPIITYNSVGDFDVELIVTNSNGSDTLLMNDFVTVTSPGIGDTLSFAENFETGSFTSSGITLNNPDGGISWEIDSNAAKTGIFSIRINNYINTNYGTVDEILLPYLDFSSEDTNHTMSFSWAYARSDALYSDDMIIQLSTDCGNTFNTIMAKSGSSLVTGPTQTSFFIPDSTQWRDASINLKKYSNEQYVLIKIVNVTDGGNNLYIDDINIDGEKFIFDGINSNVENNVSIFPNTTNEIINIKFSKEITKKRTLKIFNVGGKLISKLNVENSENIKLDVSGYNNGLYLVVIEGGNNVFTKKINIIK